MVVANSKNFVVVELETGEYVVREAAIGVKNLFRGKSFFEALEFMDNL